MMHRRNVVGVIGPGAGDERGERAAYTVGMLLARAQLNLVTGGLAGVMQQAARGFTEARAALPDATGAMSIGILPGSSDEAANPFTDLVIPTGLGEARNYVLVNTAQILIAIGKGDGTLVEIAYALRAGKPIISICSWEVDERIVRADSPEQSVTLCRQRIRS